MISTIFSLFLSGLVLGSGPCMASCGPLLISYTAATKKGFKDSLRVYAIFSLSRVLIYVLFGILVGLFSQYFLNQGFNAKILRYFYLFGSIFVFAIGVLIFFGKESRFKFCQILRKNLIEKDTKSIFLFGLLIGISPCAPLIGILSYIGLTSFSWVKGMLLSFSFGLGTVISPLIFLVIFAGLINKIFRDRERFYRILQKICGIILCILGINLFISAFLSGATRY